MGFPSGSIGKESTCNVGDLDLIPGLERYSGGGHGNPLQYSCLENPHGQRSLVNYRPWGHKELDMTEQLSAHTHTHTHTHTQFVCAISLSAYTINIRLLLYMEVQGSCRKMEDIHYT